MAFTTTDGFTRDGSLRVAMVGFSEHSPCGVRDYTARIAEALERIDVHVCTYWCNRRANLPLCPAIREVVTWTRSLSSRLRAQDPDVVVLQYSAFAYGYRGVPLLLWPVLARLRQVAAPIVVILHEFAFPWRYLGARGALWAISQRLALPFLLHTSSAIVVTTDDARTRLLGRRWLPGRPIRVLPVPSNVPLAGASTASSEKVVGVFGYGAQYIDIGSVIGAAKLTSREIAGLRLRLLGAPGPDSEVAKLWRRQANDAGVALEFSGILEMNLLSRAVSQVDLVIFADVPTSRRGTLAASLLHGRAVIAFDGPQTWPALREADAVCLVQPAPGALAAAMAWLLRDHLAREGYEGRAATFYRSVMSEDVVARQLSELLLDVRQSHKDPGSGRLSSHRVRDAGTHVVSVGEESIR